MLKTKLLTMLLMSALNVLTPDRIQSILDALLGKLEMPAGKVAYGDDRGIEALIWNAIVNGDAAGVIDFLFDQIEDAVAQSATKIDDIFATPILTAARSAWRIPDDD